MASCSTSLLASSFPMKKLKSNAKSTATTKTAEPSSSGVSSSEGDGEWFHIDDFPMPDSSAPRSLDPAVPAPFGAADASGSLDHEVVVGAAESGKPEHYRSGQESLDGGTGHATRVEKTNLALKGLFDGSSPESPLILDSDATEEHTITQVKPSNDYHAAASTEGYRAGQHDDLDADGMRTFLVEDIGSICHERPPAEDELFFGDAGETDRPLTRKRTRPSSVRTVIPPAAVLDLGSEPELEDPRSAKRQKPAERQAERPILNPVPTTNPTPLPTPSGHVSRSRANKSPGPGLPDSDRKGHAAGTPGPPPNDLLSGEGDNNDAYARETVEELLQTPGQSISRFKEIEGEQDVDPDLDRREKHREGRNGEGEGQEDELGQVDEVFRSTPPKTSPRRNRRARPAPEKRRGPSQTALRP